MSVFDVAKYILEKQGEITAMKLQKLAFYVKAWALVWDEEELFNEEFQAWANGAVSPELYNIHRGMFKVSADLFKDYDSASFTVDQKETIDKVLEFYGDYTAQQLSDINHQEEPWKNARGDLAPTARCNEVITSAAIFEYYSGVWNGEETE
ncbi:Panacea domain-containing protein [Vibrio parahaemolyticus]|uniref:Panacea domain-containing protein n=1 Tax=Vibrio rotiferianus TaxID=190895 RepID=UPI000B5A01B4|nr:type II toxin-antitoxin system antitoxin SocA domain-containing protein [Vibrio rotiferianus]ASI96277.1 hypothetical protein BSZ04_15005 [Vibrio rotiferianus]ELI5882847.1 DUF4065 domain-containing protein [Vibrio parahaemolyticus]